MCYPPLLLPSLLMSGCVDAEPVAMHAPINGADDAPIEMKGIRLAGAPLYLDMQVRPSTSPVASRLQGYSLETPLESSPTKPQPHYVAQYQAHTNPQRPAMTSTATRLFPCLLHAVPAWNVTRLNKPSSRRRQVSQPARPLPPAGGDAAGC